VASRAIIVDAMVGASIKWIASDDNDKNSTIIVKDGSNNSNDSVIVIISAARIRKCMSLLVLALATTTKTTTAATSAARCIGRLRFDDIINFAPPTSAAFLVTPASSRLISSSIGYVDVGRIGGLASHSSFSLASSSFASRRRQRHNIRPSDIAMSTDNIATNDVHDGTRIARLVSASPSSLDECGERLRNGQLVSFPTETVYGLGCHALDANAVRRVFDAKERPLSDPLIVHVSCGEDALGMWAASSSSSEVDDDDDDVRRRRIIESRALSALTSTFFPGPLTIVALARPDMPSILMAGTGYVACRSPSHVVANELIRRAGVPIAAPSANKFGHVSPTSPHHVMDDLGMEDVWIVDPGLDEADRGEGSSSVCRVGVESTVVKVEMHPPSSEERGRGVTGEEDGVVGCITVLRHGAISLRSVQASIDDAGLSGYFDVVESVRFTSEDTNNVAPGQMVRHYSPNVPCFMVGCTRQRITTTRFDDSGDGAHVDERPPLDEDERSILSRSVIIDYGGRLAPYRKHALVYRDLSPNGDPIAAASSVFETLRWSETIDGAIRVFVPELILGGEEGHDGACDDISGNEIGALALAVKDKLTRAASAVVVARFQ
jgi:L-threonylcarbamoyladenylate synthase